jgi:hypothetical protein
MSHHAAVAQEGIHLRFAAAEGLEGFERRAAAADGEDLVPEALAGLGVEHAALGAAALLEGGEGVGGQHLGPLVAVVAGRVAAGEDVAEAVGEAVPFGRGEHGDFLRTSASRSITCWWAGSKSMCSSRSNSENSSWRTVCMPLWKFLAASILSKSSRGSGAPVSMWAVMSRTTSHSQQKFP